MFHVFFASLLIRLALILGRSTQWLEDRVELSTPLNSWTRVKEGVALKGAGISPYMGDVFHETPLALAIFQLLVPWGHVIAGLFFITLDLLVGYALAQAARLHHQLELQKQAVNRKFYGKGVEPILIPRDDSLPSAVAAAYLLNPYTILSCCAYSTISLNHLSIAISLWMALKGNWFLCGLGLSLAVSFSLYPVMLILPLSLLAYKFGGVGGVVDLMVYSIGWSLLIVSVSVDVLSDGSWDYFVSVYGVILTIPDFTPNVGLFWYFFAEMFEHFRLFFLCVFQINAFIHSIPLTIRFSEHPVFLTYTLLSLISLFKSYPTVADLSLSLAFLPLWSHTFRYLRFLVVIIFCLIVTSVAGPIMWYLWIHSGSANANYYFGMTLTFSIAQIFLFLDVVHSYLTHEYDLYNGLPRINELGVPVQLKLD